ncbi:hypothetical protein CJP72_12040 [Citrobacter sp. NCU1]|uniref:hypothetical protein n=1 Tax=Citrobacter sp. NCU1 TaxID=2026683 RepID=UPI001390AF6C|nr:hypothetical protein [Citrobacter sp. NCU1]NDO81471.1 hypothetical protein [Citrobacter sp. NCU1]
MRNRAASKPGEEAFISGGTANVATTAAIVAPKGRAKSRPVTVSLTDNYLNQITTHLQQAAAEGEVSLTRTDVVKAGLLALAELPPEKVMKLLRQTKKD